MRNLFRVVLAVVAVGACYVGEAAPVGASIGVLAPPKAAVGPVFNALAVDDPLHGVYQAAVCAATRVDAERSAARYRVVKASGVDAYTYRLARELAIDDAAVYRGNCL